MKDLEKKIEEAASRCAHEFPSLMVNRASCFIKGAKSEESKEYHTQNMYTEEEILRMISKLGEFDTMSSRWLSAWFKQNKKK